jgi:hypothetical protein
MPDLGFASIQKWIGGTLLAWKEFLVGPNPANIPPSLPYRCGTMLMRCTPEGMKRVCQGWQEEEERFIAWVAAHPVPRREWLETVERLRRRQK